MARLRAVIAGVLLAALAGSAAVNASQLRTIDAELRHNYSALHRYGTGDIFEIGISQDNSARRWVAPFHYFGVLFPDAEVIVPPSGISIWFSFGTAILSFGKARAITIVPYDERSLIDLAALEEWRIPAERFASRRGPTRRIVDERVGYYAPSEPSGVFVVITPQGRPRRTEPVAFVDIALLDEATRAVLGR